jgi:hypothetical protein
LLLPPRRRRACPSQISNLKSEITAAASAPVLTNWDYRILNVTCEHLGWTVTYYTNDVPEFPAMRSADPEQRSIDTAHNLLQAIGRAGWELVSSQYDDGRLQYIFKRPDR